MLTQFSKLTWNLSWSYHVGILTFNNVINTTLESLEATKVFIFQQFSFLVKISCSVELRAWIKFYNLRASTIKQRIKCPARGHKTVPLVWLEVDKVSDQILNQFFGLIMSQSTIFQSYRKGSSWVFGLIFYFPVNNFSAMSEQVFQGWTSTKQGIQRFAQKDKAVTLPAVRLKPATQWSPV